MAEQQAKANPPKEKVALDDQLLMVLEGNLKRIFAMKITRSTFRELQNVIFSCAGQNRDLATFLFETLLSGQAKPAPTNERHKAILDELVREFTIPARLAKEVFERGEFISMVTSDAITQQDEIALFNRLRRIDGEEFAFLSDTENTVHLLHHFVGRLFELEKNPSGKKQLEKHKKELGVLAERLKQLSL